MKPEARHGRIRRLLAVAVAVSVLTLPPPAGLAVALTLIGVRTAVRLGRGLGVPSAWRARRARRLEASAPGATVLGLDEAGSPVVLAAGDLRAHGLILGASGSGKTQTMLRMLEPQIVRGGGAVVIDLKGSPALAEAVQDTARMAGRRCRVFSLDGEVRWNPLAAGNATELKDKLVGTERFTEPHYKRAAERYVQTVLRVMAETGEPVGLERIVELMNPSELLLAARGLPDERRETVSGYLHSLAHSRDQISAVRGLGSRLAVIAESHVGRLLVPGPDAIDLREALSGGDVVVFSLNSSSYGGLAAQLGTLAVQDVIAATGHRQSRGGDSLALVAIDEFSALGSDNVINLLARGREAGVGVILATQELADLDRAGPGLRDQVVGSTNVQVTHRQNVPGSARAMAEAAGTRSGWQWSYTDRGDGHPARTAREVRVPVVEAERIARFRTGEAMVQVRSRGRTAVTRVRSRVEGRDGPGR